MRCCLKTISIIILVFFIPIVFVHILFKIDCGKEWLQPEWPAGDIITYIAGFEACVSTAALSFLALWQNQKHKEENDKMERRLIEIENEKIRLSNLPQFFVWSSHYDVVIDKNYQKLHSAAPNGSWCGDQRQLSAANGSLN